jgi:hypothetical protein
MVTNGIPSFRKSLAASKAAFLVAVVIFVAPFDVWGWHCTMNICLSFHGFEVAALSVFTIVLMCVPGKELLAVEDGA